MPEVSDVAWIAPEDVRANLREKAVESIRDPNELNAALETIERDAVGEYRIVESHNEDGSTTFGELAVWVDESDPNDPDDGVGHYEIYDPTTHGEPYRPVHTPEAGGEDE